MSQPINQTRSQFIRDAIVRIVASNTFNPDDIEIHIINLQHTADALVSAGVHFAPEGSAYMAGLGESDMGGLSYNQVQQYAERVMKEKVDKLNMLAAAYAKECNIPPSQCMLRSVIGPDGCRFDWVERIPPSN